MPWLLAAAVVFTLSVMGGPAEAQTIRDDVKQFVEEELEKAEGKGEKKEEGKKEEGGTHVLEAKPPESGGGSKPRKSTIEAKPPKSTIEAKPPKTTARPAGVKTGEVTVAEPEIKDKGSDLPKRVIGKNLKIDIKPGGGYRGWVPQQYPGVSVDMASYFTWSVSVKARIFQWLNLHRGYYESNAASNPCKSGVSDAARFGDYAISAAWLLVSMGFPITDAWEPIIRYESRAFQTTAKPKAGNEVCIIPYNQSADVEGCEPSSEKLSIVSSFETAVAGVRYIPSKSPSVVAHTPGKKLPDFFFGGGYMHYVKPYQVTIGSETLKEYLFTGRFRGGGLALGTSYNGGINNIFFRVWAQIGLGEVRLTKDMTLNELAPDDWLIGYVQGSVTFGAHIAVWKFAPTLLFVPQATLGGASFYFIKTHKDEGEKTDTPNINWDFLWTIRATFVLTL